jgi:hypothetical protein
MTYYNPPTPNNGAYHVVTDPRQNGPLERERCRSREAMIAWRQKGRTDAGPSRPQAGRKFMGVSPSAPASATALFPAKIFTMRVAANQRAGGQIVPTDLSPVILGTQGLRSESARHATLAHGPAAGGPRDWARSDPLKCTCADCRQLGAFLVAADRPEWRLKAVRRRKKS